MVGTRRLAATPSTFLFAAAAGGRRPERVARQSPAVADKMGGGGARDGNSALGGGMSTTDITACLSRLGRGDPDAARLLWEQYFGKLVRLARKKLVGVRSKAADEEDVALSAMNSVYEGIVRHRFPRLPDRGDLWKILVTVTVRKACAERRRQFAQKRGAGRIRTESAFMRFDS
jgi:hypothetical protein